MTPASFRGGQGHIGVRTVAVQGGQPQETGPDCRRLNVVGTVQPSRRLSGFTGVFDQPVRLIGMVSGDGATSSSLPDRGRPAAVTSGRLARRCAAHFSAPDLDRPFMLLRRSVLSISSARARLSAG